MQVRLLGVAQDGGFPQPGCQCANCSDESLPSSAAACLAIIDEAESCYWLIDAPPQFQQAIQSLSHLKLAGIFLTHAHIGHYTGLMFLGKEAMNTELLPVYCSNNMADFLFENEPWRQLILNNNIACHKISAGSLTMIGDVQIAPTNVPHRAEFTQTYAYHIIGENKSLFYCPDIDNWPLESGDFYTILDKNDHLLLDATFFDPSELPGRDLSRVPHPFVRDTVRDLRKFSDKITLIHLNHSNPLWRQSPERKIVEDSWFTVGEPGMTWTID